MPLDFLPTIEGTATEILVGNWVIHEALRQINNWHKCNIKLEVSVNISSNHLHSATFVKDLEIALALYPHIPSYYLQLEILESSALGNLDLISKTINTCIHKLGVNVSLDDFGTGYSSLTHLRNLPAKTLKIDQSFVKDMLDSPDDYAIIDGIIGLSNAFNRDIIAEGVESIEHGLMLLMMGCHIAQGYAISKPIPAQDFTIWLANYQCDTRWTAFNKQNLNTKNAKVKLLIFSLQHWYQKIQTATDSTDHILSLWPIMKENKCHCGAFVKQIQHEQFFSRAIEQDIVHQHHRIHLQAQQVFDAHSQQDENLVAINLKALHKDISVFCQQLLEIKTTL